MFFKKKEKKVDTEMLNAGIIKANDIDVIAIKVNGNFMIGNFTCNFVWNDDIGAYVLCGYKEDE